MLRSLVGSEMCIRDRCSEYDRNRVEILRNVAMGVLAEKVHSHNEAKTPPRTVDPVLAATDAILIRVGCTTALGQTLGFEDFTQQTVAGVLNVLHLEAPCPKLKQHMSPSDRDPTSVNWVLAPTGQMLLQTFPLPYRRFEPSEKIVYGY
eukprot:TRINITY_DN39081_c0_g2_i1.p1 TRINITY_DN39081_c0_g2~~TRINITY_DN39081_c0_g2_i1.p1  ORF type:complete len:149 (+),score=22.75 TRINITY_DN39081_c0_g2_i1:95-541(+)